MGSDVRGCSKVRGLDEATRRYGHIVGGRDGEAARRGTRTCSQCSLGRWVGPERGLQGPGGQNAGLLLRPSPQSHPGHKENPSYSVAHGGSRCSVVTEGRVESRRWEPHLRGEPWRGGASPSTSPRSKHPGSPSLPAAW